MGACGSDDVGWDVGQKTVRLCREDSRAEDGGA